MQIGGVDVPGSRAFKFGTLITFGIVVFAGILSALPIVGGIVILFGWGIGFLAGVAGAVYAVNSVGIEPDAGGDGAKIGAVVGLVGNALGAVVGIVIALITSLVGFEPTQIPSQTPGGAPIDIGAGSLVVAVLILGGIGFVTGTILALLGGALGGYVATRF